MDLLRARAYLDLLLGKDSRPRPGDAAARRTWTGRPGRPGGPLGARFPPGSPAGSP